MPGTVYVRSRFESRKKEPHIHGSIFLKKCWRINVQSSHQTGGGLEEDNGDVGLTPDDVKYWQRREGKKNEEGKRR